MGYRPRTAMVITATEPTSPRIFAAEHLRPSINPSKWPFLRHLIINLLYTPARNLRDVPYRGDAFDLEKPRCFMYISKLAELLEATARTLRTLTLLVNRDFLNLHNIETHVWWNALHEVELNKRFACAVSVMQNVKAGHLVLHFRSDYHYFNVKIEWDVLLKKGILKLGAHIEFARFGSMEASKAAIEIANQRVPQTAQQLARFPLGAYMQDMAARAGILDGNGNLLSSYDWMLVEHLITLSAAHTVRLVHSGRRRKIDLAPLLKLLGPEEWWTQ